MKILVCIASVPDTTTKIVVNDGQIDNTNTQFIIGPYEAFALAKAVEMKASGDEITVLHVGKSDADPVIRKALAIGADKAVRIDADATDGFFVANEIYHYAKDKAFDMILMGREASDYNGGQVHAMVAELMNIPNITPCMHFEVNGSEVMAHREIDGGKQEVKATLPIVAGCQEPIAEWKIPNMRGIMMARKKPLEVLAPSTDAVQTTHTSYTLPEERSACKMIDPDNIGELVELLRNEAKVI